VVNKVASKFAESFSFRRDSVRERRRSLIPGARAISCARRGSTANSSSAAPTAPTNDPSLQITLLQDTIAPLHTDIKQMQTALREVWSEITQISRRLNHLDGKWM
jgi:hypothetical protein